MFILIETAGGVIRNAAAASFAAGRVRSEYGADDFLRRQCLVDTARTHRDVLEPTSCDAAVAITRRQQHRDDLHGWGDFAVLGQPGDTYQYFDYRLLRDSPCVDAGDPNLAPPGGSDLEGHMRVWDGDQNGTAVVDMGAYEYGSHPFGDMNCDHRFNGGDIDPFFFALGDPIGYAAQFPNCNPLLGDMNGDGRLDGGDIDPFFHCLGAGGCP